MNEHQQELRWELAAENLHIDWLEAKEYRDTEKITKLMICAQEMGLYELADEMYEYLKVSQGNL